MIRTALTIVLSTAALLVAAPATTAEAAPAPRPAVFRICTAHAHANPQDPRALRTCLSRLGGGRHVYLGRP